MKSSIKFDLNGQNEAVITAKIVQTDDVRDKVAKQNFERLRYESTLAFVYCVNHSVTAGIVDNEPTQEWEIKTVNPYQDDCDWLTQRLSNRQLYNLQEAIEKEIYYRKKGANTIIGTGELIYGSEDNPRDKPYVKPALYEKTNKGVFKLISNRFITEEINPK